MSTRESTSTRDQVRELHRAGVPVRKIALALGVSTQRVYQHVKWLRDNGELPPKEAA